MGGPTAHLAIPLDRSDHMVSPEPITSKGYNINQRNPTQSWGLAPPQLQGFMEENRHLCKTDDLGGRKTMEMDAATGSISNPDEPDQGKMQTREQNWPPQDKSSPKTIISALMT